MSKEKKKGKALDKEDLKKKAKQFAKDLAKEIKEKTPEIDESLPAVNISECETAIEESMMDLIYNEPFYAELTMRMRREVTDKFPTLAVGPKDNEIYLYINPYFFCNYNIAERVGFLKHECLHVVGNHFVRARDLEPRIYDEAEKKSKTDRAQDMTKASILNQAMDFAINQYIPVMPKKVKILNNDGKALLNPAKTPDGKANPDVGKPLEGDLCTFDFLKKKFPQAEPTQNFEYYYRMLKEENEKDENQDGEGEGAGAMTLDDHSAWHESDMDEETITEKVKDLVNKAAEAAEDRQAGSIPSEVQEALDALNYVPKDWRQDIQRFVARSAEILVEPCRKKRNRRYGVIYPGFRKEPIMHLAVAIDASGSVRTEELNQFFAEIGRLDKMGVDITIVEFDAKVNAVYKFDPKKDIKIHGRGGTCFKPPLDLLSSREFSRTNGDVDGIIFFTDGGCWESEKELTKPKAPLLWALVQTDDLPISWGARTKVEVKKKVRR